MMANPVANCKTSMGTFKLELYVDQMPVTASNFIALAKEGYYDGLTFHRVIPNFVGASPALAPPTPPSPLPLACTPTHSHRSLHPRKQMAQFGCPKSKVMVKERRVSSSSSRRRRTFTHGATAGPGFPRPHPTHWLTPRASL